MGRPVSGARVQGTAAEVSLAVSLVVLLLVLLLCVAACGGTDTAGGRVLGASPASSELHAKPTRAGPVHAPGVKVYRQRTPVPTLDSSAPTCARGHVRFASFAYTGGMTGERGVAVLVRNVGAGPCNVDGFARVTLLDSRGALPLRYQSGGGPYLSPPGSATPALITIPVGKIVVGFQVVKYRCDLGDLRTATAMRIDAPGFAHPVIRRLPGSERDYDVCKGGVDDPGQLVYVGALTQLRLR